VRTTLANKFVFLISVIAALGFLNGVTALVFTWSVAKSFRSAVIEDLSSIEAAEELEDALLTHRGELATYILGEQNPAHLKQFCEAEARFGAWLPRAWDTVNTTEESRVLVDLEKAYAEYDAKGKKALLQCSQGRRNEAAATVIHEVWPAYDEVHKSCKEFADVNNAFAEAYLKRSERYVHFAVWGVVGGSLGTAGLASVLFWLVVRRVLIPLRRIVADARAVVGRPPGVATEAADDELRSIGIYFRALMADVAATHTTLVESRSRLSSAEKLASLGKLAASVAHEMRNPLSSMKMWLYSIRKSAGAEPSLDRKYQILSDEITRLENIVRNILEFSRRFVLKLEPQSIRRVIDNTLEILRLELEAKNIRVVQCQTTGLPPVMADVDQLTQVFINLLGNAAEAMPEGGQVSISGTAETDSGGSAAVAVRVQDTGHGIPDDVRSRLFEPFFTTKEQGTGLGLCIAANIMARHGGQLVLESSTAGGSTFVVWVPIATEKRDEQDSGR